MKHLIYTLLFFGLSYSQTVPERKVYTDIIIENNYLYALSKEKKIAVWDLNSLEQLFTTKDTIYTAIAKDRNNIIYAGTGDGVLLKLSKTDFTFTERLKLKKKGPVHNIFFNSGNKIFVVIGGGVYNPVTNELWRKFTNKTGGLNVSKRKKFLFFSYNVPTNIYFMIPGYTFMDTKDAIWMGKMFGEFGTVLHIFDAKEEKILNSDFWDSKGGLYLQSIFEDDKKNVYITSGLQHFRNHGQIYKIVDGKAVTIYKNPESKKGEDPNDRLFIGPGAFNTSDQKLYFATQKGIYRASVPNEGEIKEIELVFTPELLYSRENLAIGYQMAIKKIEFTVDNKLIFLTVNNGIGIYDGQHIKMLD